MKKHIWRRIVSLYLAALMLITGLPLTSLSIHAQEKYTFTFTTYLYDTDGRNITGDALDAGSLPAVTLQFDDTIAENGWVGENLKKFLASVTIDASGECVLEPDEDVTNELSSSMGGTLYLRVTAPEGFKAYKGDDTLSVDNHIEDSDLIPIYIGSHDITGTVCLMLNEEEDGEEKNGGSILVKALLGDIEFTEEFATPKSGITFALQGADPVYQTTGEDGTALFEGLMPGEYEVAFSGPVSYETNGTSTKTVTVEEGETSDVSFYLYQKEAVSIDSDSKTITIDMSLVTGDSVYLTNTGYQIAGQGTAYNPRLASYTYLFTGTASANTQIYVQTSTPSLILKDLTLHSSISFTEANAQATVRINGEVEVDSIQMESNSGALTFQNAGTDKDSLKVSSIQNRGNAVYFDGAAVTVSSLTAETTEARNGSLVSGSFSVKDLHVTEGSSVSIEASDSLDALEIESGSAATLKNDIEIFNLYLTGEGSSLSSNEEVTVTLTSTTSVIEEGAYISLPNGSLQIGKDTCDFFLTNEGTISVSKLLVAKCNLESFACESIAYTALYNKGTILADEIGEIEADGFSSDAPVEENRIYSKSAILKQNQTDYPASDVDLYYEINFADEAETFVESGIVYYEGASYALAGGDVVFYDLFDTYGHGWKVTNLSADTDSFLAASNDDENFTTTLTMPNAPVAVSAVNKKVFDLYYIRNNNSTSAAPIDSITITDDGYTIAFSDKTSSYKSYTGEYLFTTSKDVERNGIGSYNAPYNGPHIMIDAKSQIHITLSDVTSWNAYRSRGGDTYFDVISGTAVFELDGENRMAAYDDGTSAGVFGSSTGEGTLIFRDANEDGGSLTVRGSSCYHNGGMGFLGGNIIIESGTVSAFGGGGGNSFGLFVDNLTIKGGTLNIAGGSNEQNRLFVADTFTIEEGASFTLNDGAELKLGYNTLSTDTSIQSEESKYSLSTDKETKAKLVINGTLTSKGSIITETSSLKDSYLSTLSASELETSISTVQIGSTGVFYDYGTLTVPSGYGIINNGTVYIAKMPAKTDGTTVAPVSGTRFYAISFKNCSGQIESISKNGYTFVEQGTEGTLIPSTRSAAQYKVNRLSVNGSEEDGTASFTMPNEVTTVTAFGFKAEINMSDYAYTEENKNPAYQTINLTGVSEVVPYSVTYYYYNDNTAETVWTNSESVSVGTYQMYAVLKVSGYADYTTDEITFTVKKITVDDPVLPSVTYDGASHTPILSDTALYTASNPVAATNVGTPGSIDVTLTDPDNYTWSDTDEATKTLTFAIDPLPVIVSWQEPLDMVYNGSEKEITASVSNKVGSDAVKLAIDGGKNTNAGSYTAEATAVDNANYTVTDGSNLTHTYSILQETNDWGLVPLEQDFTYTYGSDYTIPRYTARFGEVEVSYRKAGSEDAYSKTAPTTPGEYEVLYSVAETANYTGLTVTRTLVINKRTATLKGADIVKTYGDADFTLTLETRDTDGTLIFTSNDTSVVTVDENGKVTVVGAGKTTITVKASAGDTYKSTETNVNITVEKAKNSWLVTPSITTKTYDGQAITALGTSAFGEVTIYYGKMLYDNMYPSSTENYGSWGMYVNGWRNTTPFTNVGNYSAFFEVKGTDNYDGLTYVVNFKIEKKALSVTASPQKKKYAAEDPSLTYEVTGLIDGETLSGSLTRQSGEKVGTYKILQGSLSASGNYSLSFTEGELVIEANPGATITEKSEDLDAGETVENKVNDADVITETTVTASDGAKTVTEYEVDEEYLLTGRKIVTKYDADGEKTERITYEESGRYVKDDFDPELIEGNGSAYVPEEKSLMTFRSDDELINFTEVRINGVLLDPQYYDVVHGSIRVTLHQDYLETLTPGTYTMDIVSTNGDATGQFTIKAPVPAPVQAQTSSGSDSGSSESKEVAFSPSLEVAETPALVVKRTTPKIKKVAATVKESLPETTTEEMPAVEEEESTATSEEADVRAEEETEKTLPAAAEEEEEESPMHSYYWIWLILLLILILFVVEVVYQKSTKGSEE